MLIGISLIILVIGAVAFHFWSPWTYTELASNWGQIDFTLDITLVLTGVVFIIINLFVAYCVMRYRYNKDRTADFDPENKKMEWILIAITSLGVIFLLAPGLFVYSEFVSPPEDAMIVEVVGQQFAWSFRFPGEDGILGRSDMRFVDNIENPYGIDPDDPHGHDDILVQQGELHLPVGHPVQTQMRSKDVLHDFYVPNFRVKMDLVPGLVTSLWFTPTETGTYEIVCAEYCGRGHHTMGGTVIVEDQASFDAWLAQFPVFKPDVVVELTIEQIGERLAKSACLSCHSIDGTPALGPTWQGLYGKQETLSDGSTVTVDDAYITESIREPNAKIVQGFAQGGMPAFPNLSDEDIAALIAYMKTLAN